jgi:Rrf2 family iron-sulfur cluster assembly transcriptional regulator
MPPTAAAENCHDEQRCMTHDLWTNLNKRMHEYLARSLADLVKQPKAKAGGGDDQDERLRAARPATSVAAA